MLKVSNLEQGLRTVDQARQTLFRELDSARRSGQRALKLIHGYGSSGVGGEIRIAIGRALQEMHARGEVTHVVFGEDWGVSDPTSWKLLNEFPVLKKDRDLGRHNRGITIVWL